MKQPFIEIAQEISERIREGRYPTGSPLPSRPQLCEEFKVARATLDKAIQELVRRNLVASRHGAGTFVCNPEKSSTLVALIGNVSASECRNLPFVVDQFSASEFKNRSSWGRLRSYDGLLLVRPEKNLFPLMDELKEDVKMVLVNRVREGIGCVSTDHCGAYRTITAERLTKNPEASVVFLQSAESGLAVQYRLNGFIQACEAAGRNYEIWKLDGLFERKLDSIRRRMKNLPETLPIVMVSDSRSHTGAVITVARERHLQIGHNFFYSDFDNDYEENVWGVVITSFLQDNDRLLAVAAEKLLRRIHNQDVEADAELLFPLRRYGQS